MPMIYPPRLKVHPLRGPRKHEAFTLIELITATAILGVVLSTVWAGLITLLEANRDKVAELNRKHELNRAADFIADDIRSGGTVATDVTMVGGPNQGLFEIRDDSGVPTIAYYVTPKGNSQWQGPYVLRRKLNTKRTQALVDGISNDLSLECLTGTGNTKRKGGVRVSLLSEKTLKICLVGHLGENNLISVLRQVHVRN